MKKNTITVKSLLIILISAFTLSSCNFFPAECKPDLSLKASNANKIKRYKGCEATVSGYVYSTYKPKSGKVFFLNLGNSNYKKAFTGVIFKNNFKEFDKPLSSYEGKEISIYGTIDTYENRPQIIINQPEQINNLENDHF